MAEITQTQLHELLKYDPETGHFTRLTGRHVGKIAGYQKEPSPGDKPYWAIQIGSRAYQAHRLAWLYMTGEWPKALTDHKDGDSLNNRWLNLREADFSTNTQNSCRRSDNRSGLKGVNYTAARGWKARISLHGRRIHLGRFPTAEAAHAAYKEAAEKLFGEFARVA